MERASLEYDTVLLIDGVFHHDLAPSPKECYAATLNAKMYGAASMGALRAAECWPYGFTPLGIIARWYIKEVIDGDDEVAVLTHPTTHAALTVPMVNVRYVAWLARRRGIMSKSECEAFIDKARDIFYMDRSWACVLEGATKTFGNVVTPIEQADLKRMDASFALRTLTRQSARCEEVA